VVGLAASVPFDKTDPRSPVNRRISIVVLNPEADNAPPADSLPGTLPGNGAPAPGAMPDVGPTRVAGVRSGMEHGNG
jgi:chemotaxis protein MotB